MEVRTRQSRFRWSAGVIWRYFFSADNHLRIFWDQ
jgi:hypothetical protein